LRLPFTLLLSLAAASGLIFSDNAMATQPVDDRDAPPKVRIPPDYPEKCLANAKKKEAVLIEFDVSPEGKVTNAKVIDTTNACFDGAALASVQRWKYRPAKDENGERRWRRGVQTVTTFELQ
jgi:protein TonB